MAEEEEGRKRRRLRVPYPVSKRLWFLGYILCLFRRHKYREDGRICMRCLRVAEEKFE